MIKRIGVLGSRGRMGQEVTRLIRTDFKSSASLSAEVNSNDSVDTLLNPQMTDVIIDFSSASAVGQLATVALNQKSALPAFVIGSTGWTPEHRVLLENLSKKTGVLVAANFSLGIYAMSEILKKYSAVFNKLNYTPVMVETHHSHKKDAPSGTALFLKDAIQQPLQIHSIRAGEVIGEHEVTFYGSREQLQIKHTALNRSVFAEGAVQSALWLCTMPQQNRILGIEDYFRSLQSENE